jgi:hypothetical protein
MLEEADADIIVLCDCCHSTAIPTTGSQRPKGNKVMEAITDCGYEQLQLKLETTLLRMLLPMSLRLPPKYYRSQLASCMLG